MQAYFDNSATTAPCEEAIEKINYALQRCWGNPSSLHFSGNEASALLEESRKEVAQAVGCKPEEILFTSGGTESNNLAVFGAANAMKRFGNRIVTTSAEHPSVYEAVNELENMGFEVIRLAINSEGKISEDDLFSAVNDKTILVSMMYVNNEVGSVMPVEKVRKAILRAHSPALFHVDAVQAFGKMNIKPSLIGADLMTISSHKIHGPKGVGALYIRKDVKIKPHTFGGEQGKKIRPGTEAMPAIAGFGAAAKALPDIREELSDAMAKRDYMLSKFEDIGGIEVNSPKDALPFVTNISVLGVKSEVMLNYLSGKGICVSSGSACSKGHRSRVLSEMGLSKERMDTPIRISFSRFTTYEEIDYLAENIRKAIEEIYHI